MQSNTLKMKQLFDFLVSINQRVMEQIPYPANYFADFDTPPLGEHIPDVQIQARLHENLRYLLGLYDEGMKVLNKLKREYFKAGYPKEALRSYLVSQSHSITEYINRGLKATRIYDASKVDVLKTEMATLIEDSVANGEAELSFEASEQLLIDAFIKGLNENLDELMDRFAKGIKLEKEDIKLLKLYSHDEITADSFTQNPSSLQHFCEQAKHHINELKRKVDARQITYAERQQSTALRVENQNIFLQSYTNSPSCTLALQTDAAALQDYDSNTDTNFQLYCGLFLKEHRIAHGFCWEHTILALVLLIEYGESVIDEELTIEQVSLDYIGGDGHGFLVINRAAHSLLNDISTWGDECIILDSWAHLVCYAKDLARQNKQYLIYPANAKWHTLHIDNPIYRLWLLKKHIANAQLTSTMDPQQRELRVIEEFQLYDIEAKDQVILDFLNELLDSTKPKEFRMTVRFKLTVSGNQMVYTAPWCRELTIVIHEDCLEGLARGDLSLDAFEFALAIELLKAKRRMRDLAGEALSNKERAEVDNKAIELVGLTDAGIEYLRKAQLFSESHPEQTTVIKAIIHSASKMGYAERLKIMTTAIVSGMVDELTREPKKLTADSLNALNHFRKRSAPIHYLMTDPVAYNELSRCDKLNKLKELLPELHLYLISPEGYGIHETLRVREFCQYVKELDVDFNDEHEAQLVDQIINKAEELQVPGFEMIYQTFSKLGGIDLTYSCDIKYGQEMPETVLRTGRYHLVHQQYTNYKLYYGADNQNHEIPTNSEAFRIVFSELGWRPSLAQMKLQHLIQRFFAMSPLGFFKEGQDLISRFVNAEMESEALQSAMDLKAYLSKYPHHFSNRLGDREKHFYNALENVTLSGDKRAPFLGTLIGSNLNYQGFVGPEYSESRPWKRFLPWAAADESGVIAHILYRLGVRNDPELLIMASPASILETTRNGKSIPYSPITALTGSLIKYERFGPFDFYAEQRALSTNKQEQIPASFEIGAGVSFQSYLDAYLKEHWSTLSISAQQNAIHPLMNHLLESFNLILTQGTDDDIEVLKQFYLSDKPLGSLKSLLNTRRLFLTHSFLRFMIYARRFDALLFNQMDMVHAVSTGDYLDLYGTFDLKYHIDDYAKVYRVNGLSFDEKFRGILAVTAQHHLPYVDAILLNLCPDITAFSAFSERFNIFIDFHLNNTIDTLPNWFFSYTNWDELYEYQNALGILNSVALDRIIIIYCIFESEGALPVAVIRNNIYRHILQRIDGLGSVDMRIQYYEQFLFRKDIEHPSFDLDALNEVSHLLISCYLEKYGTDPNTLDYYKQLLPVITRLMGGLANKDRTRFLDRFLEALISQQRISDYVGFYLDQSTKLFKQQDTGQSALYASLVQISNLFSEKIEWSHALLDFLSAPYSGTSARQFADYIETNIGEYRLANIFNELQRSSNSKDTLNQVLSSIYRMFWDRSLKERTALVESLLLPPKVMLSEETYEAAYQSAFKYISDKLFVNADDPESDDCLGLSLIKAYLNAAPRRERSYLITAILFSTAESSAGYHSASIGKKLARVCEHMGPAYVKFAQAIHSHPDTSDAIRKDLAHIKGKANPQSRWELWRQMAEVLPKALLNEIKHVGVLLGSASFNLALPATMNNGEELVISLLRDGAELSAMKGFNHLKKAVGLCDHPKVQKHCEVVMATIDEADRLSQNEMSVSASIAQSVHADHLYKQRLQLVADGQPVSIEVRTAHIITSGTHYRLIDRMYGTEFNHLPDSTAHERRIKKAIAIAVFQMELHNLLRGGPFDSDRHGNQCCIEVLQENPLTLRLGLYDFGEMSLESPSDVALHQMASVLSSAGQLATTPNYPLDQLITDVLESARQRGESIHYLMRVRKCILAMNDFIRYLDSEDIKSAFVAVSKHKDIHPILYWPLFKLTSLISAHSAAEKMNAMVNKSVAWFGSFGLFQTTNQAGETKESTSQEANPYDM